MHAPDRVLPVVLCEAAVFVVLERGEEQLPDLGDPLRAQLAGAESLDVRSRIIGKPPRPDE
jgi:hypothetical protein